MEALPFSKTPVIVRRVLAHFGLRRTLRASKSAVSGALQNFQPGPNPAQGVMHMRTGQATLEYKINVI